MLPTRMLRRLNILAPGIAILLTILLSTSPSFAQKEFIPWEEQVFQQISQEFGQNAAERLRAVHDLVIQHFHDTDRQKLKVANDYTNSLPWIADAAHWHKNDFWATPLETLATFGGDCEDLAIMKYLLLRLMGVLDDTLGFAYVVTTRGERHMVLVYKAGAAGRILVLDNLNPRILPAKDRPDLTAVYVFKNKGRFFLIKDTGKAHRTVLTKKDHQKFQKWLTVKARAVANSAKYAQYNGGRPLLPDYVLKK